MKPKWMVGDSSEVGFQILNKELIESSREKRVEEEEGFVVEVETDTGQSVEVFVGLKTVLKWMESKPECDHIHERERGLGYLKMYEDIKDMTTNFD